MDFGPRLKHYRRRAHKTQEELAAALGTDGTYVSKLEKLGGPRPQRETIDAAADFLGLSQDERDELLLLAEHMPTDIQQELARPATRQLLRSLGRLSEAEQEQVLDEVLRRLNPVDDPESPGREGGA